jgi:hypothetical protein
MLLSKDILMINGLNPTPQHPNSPSLNTPQATDNKSILAGL